MRGLARDMRKLWVSLYSGKSKVMSGGMWTGEWKVARSEPFPIYASLSPASGAAVSDVFGISADYDRVATLDYTRTGITETAVFWVDSEPEFDADGRMVVDASGNPSVPFDYLARRVAESPNVTSIALKRVEVS